MKEKQKYFFILFPKLAFFCHQTYIFESLIKNIDDQKFLHLRQ